MDNFEADNLNKEPILNASGELYILFQYFLSKYMAFENLVHLQSQALYFSRFIIRFC